MIRLNPFAISGLFILITYLPLFLTILLKGNSRITRIYSLHLLAVCGWGLGSFLIGISKGPSQSLEIWKFAYASVLFIPVFFQHTILELIGKKNTPYLVGIYLQAIIFCILLQKGFITSELGISFGNIHYFGYSNYYFVSMLIWILLVIYSHIQLHTQNTETVTLHEYSTLFWAVLSFTGGLFNFLPVFGFNVYPLGNFLIPSYVFIITYAIFKNHFFEIRVVLKQSISYSILITIITITYLVCVISLEKLMQTVLNYDSVLLSIITAFLFGILFIPLKNRLQTIVDILFFKKSPKAIAMENKQLLQYVSQTDKYRTLATLAGGIAHEIRNPLTVIKTFTEYLPQKHHDEEFIQKYSALTAKEVSRIEDLVTQLMSYSKPNPPQFRPTPLKKLIEDSLDVLNNQLLSRRIRCSRQLDLHDDLQLKLDPNQIHQVILNIVLNAVEAMPDGGTREVSTSIQKKPQTKVILCFRDNGPGIAPEHLPQIFDPFFTNKDIGTGLGLAIVQSIVENHHGKIFANSRLGAGTEIIIELPVGSSVPAS
ncbi:MAG: hypothetical protein K8I00_00325 [Candidatus Omnitrophica bacterium]|nr:hypothetical protein [Candidatus Omnitrophota bacterium]